MFRSDRRACRGAGEQLVQLRRAVGPEDVGGLGHCDARSEEAPITEALGVGGHALQAGPVEIVEEGLQFGVVGGRGPDQQHNGCSGHLGTAARRPLPTPMPPAALLC